LTTEVAYVCGAEFKPLLYISLQSLLASNTTFDRVSLYIVGSHPDWHFKDDRIVVCPVDDIGDQGWGKSGCYWGTNKTHFCSSEADRVIYLDADTLVLGAIDESYEGKDADVIARPAVPIYTDRWTTERQEQWSSALETAGAERDFPLYSPGFMVMQNSSHVRIRDTWRRLIREILAGDLPPMKPDKHAELYAYSLACGVERMSHEAMPPAHHRYAMIGEEFDDAIVYHLGTPGFYRHYDRVLRGLGEAAFDRRSVPTPRFMRLRGLSHRIRHRIKTRLFGNRARRGEY